MKEKKQTRKKEETNNVNIYTYSLPASICHLVSHLIQSHVSVVCFIFFFINIYLMKYQSKVVYFFAICFDFIGKNEQWKMKHIWLYKSAFNVKSEHIQTQTHTHTHTHSFSICKFCKKFICSYTKCSIDRNLKQKFHENNLKLLRKEKGPSNRKWNNKSCQAIVFFFFKFFLFLSVFVLSLTHS